MGQAGTKAYQYWQNVGQAMQKASTRGWSTGLNASHKTASAVERGGGKITVVATVGLGAVRLAKSAKNGNVRESTKAVTGTAGSLGGGAGGALLGAEIGTAIFPGVGTVLGGIVGGVAGAMTSSRVAEQLTDVACDQFNAEELCNDCNA